MKHYTNTNNPIDFPKSKINERLLLLMKQADYPAPEIANRAQKLAQLIVFECIKIAVFNGDSKTGEKIKEHFGVE